MDELRLAVRRLRKRPASTLASIATLAGSIGAAVVMWTVLHALLIKPLRVENPESLFALSATRGEELVDGFVFSRYQEIRSSTRTADVAGWGTWGVRNGAEPVPARVHFVSANYFGLLGALPSQGRAFSIDDDRPHGALAAIVTEYFWRRSLGARDDVLGATIDVGGKRVEIVGVAPRGFRGADLAQPADFFMPLETVEDVVPFGNFLQRDRAKGFSPNSWVRLIAKPRPGVPLQDLSRATGLSATPLQVAALPRRDRTAVVQFTRLLSFTVGLLLLVGCGTTALLMLVRAEQRRVELATSLALGAGRRRLVSGVAIEGLLTSAAGAALSLPVASVLFGLIETYTLPGGVQIAGLDLGIGAREAGVAAAAAVFTTLLISSVVAGTGISYGLTALLQSHGRGSTPRPTRMRSALIAIQVGAAVALAAGTLLFVRSLQHAIHVNPGRDSGRTVTAYLEVNTLRWEPGATDDLYRRVAARLEGNAAIERMSIASWLGGMSSSGQLKIDGVPRRLGVFTEFICVSPDYFETKGLPIIEGRHLRLTDVAGAPRVAVVSASFARAIGQGGSAVGHRVGLFYGVPPADVEIVGVVPDLITNVRRLRPYSVYMPAGQHPRELSKPGELAILAAGDADDVKREILAAARAENAPLTPVVRTLRDSLYDQMRPQQLGATVLGALGTIAVLLTVLGLYVIAESTAAQRMRELGIRAALGATRADLRALLVRDNLRLAALGAILGLVIVYAAAGTLQSFLFGVESFDPLTLSLVPSAIVTIAVLVGLGPALRASRADLARVLRD